MVGKLKLSVRKSADPLLVWLGSNWGIAVLFGGITFVLLSSVLIFHETTFFTNLDNVDQFYTWYQKLATSVHHGYLPIWNANVFSGQSFAGELQPGVFYPLNLLWVALFGSLQGISELALNYLVATHFAIAAFGCYLLVKQLGAQKWTAFLAGLTFAFSGVVAFRSISQTAIFFGLTLVPYPIYFLARFHDDAKKRARWVMASGAFLGLIILAGHIQPFFHALVAIGIFELVYLCKQFAGVQSVLKSAKVFFIVLCSAAVVAAPQVWVSAGYLPHTYRIQAAGYSGPDDKIDYGEFSKPFNLEIHEFINLIDPVTYPIRDGNNIFIGLAPLGIIILALTLAGKRLKSRELWEKHGTFTKALLVFSIVAMLGYVTWVAVVLYELPFVYQIRQLGRYSILFHVALVAILAIALEAVVRTTWTKRQRRAILLVGAFLLIEAVYLLLLRHHIFSLHHALQVGLLALTLVMVALVPTAVLRTGAISAVVVVTAGVNTLWFLPNIKSDTQTVATYALPSKLVDVLEQTNGQYRVAVQDGAVPMNIGNVYNVQTIVGYSATVYAPYYEFVHDPALDPEFRDDLMGVRLVATKQIPKDGEEIAYSDPETSLYIVSRTTALPKFFTSDVAGSISRQDYHALEVSTQKYTDQYQKYVVTTAKDVTAILSEIAYKGWEARIDGHRSPVKIYSIGRNPLLKSLDIPAGSHTIELIYRPFKL